MSDLNDEASKTEEAERELNIKRIRAEAKAVKHDGNCEFCREPLTEEAKGLFCDDWCQEQHNRQWDYQKRMGLRHGSFS